MKYTVFNKYRQMKPHSVAASLAMVILLLQGCVSVSSLPSNAPAGLPAKLPAGFFIPTGTFSKSVSDLKQAPVPVTIPIASTPVAQSRRFIPEVLLYASPSTRDYFASGGLDTKVNIRIWETFLRKYNIAFKIVSSMEQLESIQPGVLLLPSSVALSERERQAVIDFRAKGGSVLASWLIGVRNEKGEWLGFDFMANALDARVVGNTEEAEDDNFMMPYGDSPVTHYLPAGLRIWLERSREWYPLRLLGRYPAAQIMDWPRTFVSGKQGGAIVFDERAQSSGRLSRSVVLGYPEQLWLSADPKLLEAVAHNALMWLLRQPDAYLSAWPYPYASAFVLAVDSNDVIAEVDLNFAKSLEAVGGRATYYMLSENAQKSAEVLKKMQARGHEVAFSGDRFKGFKGQSSGEQAKRFDTMRREMLDAGIRVDARAGFHAPMESFDKTTEKLLNERAFGHYVSFMDASDARLPFIAPDQVGSTQTLPSLVVLPRTQSGPEDDDRDAATGMREFLNELDLAQQMAGLSVVRISNQSLLGKAQLTEFFNHLKTLSERMWLTTGSHVAEWWRERERVSARLESGAQSPQLTVTIKGEGVLKRAGTVLINLPESGSTLRLLAGGNYSKPPKIVRVDVWRMAVVLDGFEPGEYRWALHFDRPTANVTN
jgi:Polysaccharide deacetylase